ncbi:MAG: DUF1963 domain-containing protein [Lysobacterales bacterium]
MFDTPADIRLAFDSLSYRVPPAAIEQVVQVASPIVSFIARDIGARGATRFGGVPDLPKDAHWPRLPDPESLGEIVAPYEGYDLARVQKRLASQHPLAFVGQVELSQLPKKVPKTSLFPDSGRLLFFYDLASYDSGVWTAKVIWDQTATVELTSLAVPDELLKAHAKDFVDVVKNDRFNAELEREYGHGGVDPTELPETSQYLFPPTPVTPVYTLVLPDYSALESEPLANQTVDIDGESFEFSDIIEDVAYHHEKEQQETLSHFLMAGPPNPEQDDPRHDAAKIVGGAADDWVLLLQIGVSGLMQRNTEGTVYFLIRKDHLKRRHFDQVVGVYQQT